MKQTTQTQQKIEAGMAELAELVATVGETAAAAPAKREAAAAPSWLTLAESVEDAQTVLTDLVGWLGDVYVRYADAARGLPQCWLWHPEVVEELLWLMCAWLAAYRDHDASVKAVADWHDRLRPGVVRRISENYAKSCSVENHLAHRALPPARVPLPGAAEQIVTWWATSRRESAPVPTQVQLDEAVAEANRARPGGER